jgi:hypothetical protein
MLSHFCRLNPIDSINHHSMTIKSSYSMIAGWVPALLLQASLGATDSIAGRLAKKHPSFLLLAKSDPPYEVRLDTIGSKL